MTDTDLILSALDEAADAAMHRALLAKFKGDRGAVSKETLRVWEWARLQRRIKSCGVLIGSQQ